MYDKNKKRTAFSEIGKIEAISRLFKETGYNNGDISIFGDNISSHTVLLEGVDFDLVYTPLTHLGYKAVLSVIGNIYAGFHKPKRLSIILGISSRFSYEDIATFWEGVLAAAKEHHISELHLELNPSMTGLSISLCAIGEQKKKILSKKQSAKNMDLICLSGNIGAAYMGMHVLDREKVSFVSTSKDANDEEKQPDLSKYKYILAAYLSPEINPTILDRFIEFDITPSSGYFITKGLADTIKKLTRDTTFGAKIYLDKIPISSHTFEMAEELNIDAITAALNGGDDYKFIFTIPIEKHETFRKEFQDFDIIGHLCKPETGSVLVTPEGAELEIKAQGWK